MRTVRIDSELPTDADRVWSAIQHPASLTYVCRGLLGVPALAGRTDTARVGESATTRLMLFHCIPLSRHTIHVVAIDQVGRSMRTHEHGGILRSWNHTLHVAHVSARSCRYSDTVEIDAGAWTPVVAMLARLFYRYRRRRWHRLVRRHLPAGPASAR